MQVSAVAPTIHADAVLRTLFAEHRLPPRGNTLALQTTWAGPVATRIPVAPLAIAHVAPVATPALTGKQRRALSEGSALARLVAILRSATLVALARALLKASAFLCALPTATLKLCSALRPMAALAPLMSLLSARCVSATLAALARASLKASALLRAKPTATAELGSNLHQIGALALLMLLLCAATREANARASLTASAFLRALNTEPLKLCSTLRQLRALAPLMWLLCAALAVARAWLTANALHHALTTEPRKLCSALRQIGALALLMALLCAATLLLALTGALLLTCALRRALKAETSERFIRLLLARALLRRVCVNAAPANSASFARTSCLVRLLGRYLAASNSL